MKVTVFIFLFLGASINFVRAQTPADSGKSPWRLPFSISLVANYEEQDFDAIYDINGINNSLDTTLADFDVLKSARIQMLIDSTFMQSITGNTLNFNNDTNYDLGTQSVSKWLQITFDSGYDSIISLSCSTDSIFNCGRCVSRTSINFTFSGLRFDSASIIYPDSTLSHAGFSYSSVFTYDVFYKNTEAREIDDGESIGVSQITLGRIFRASTLSAPAKVSNSNQTPHISFQSYPNPFSQSTTISFTTETSGYAGISIVNLLGNEVAHLFYGELAAGQHSFVWSNPTGLPDGTYECLLRMNGHVETLPVVLLR